MRTNPIQIYKQMLYTDVFTTNNVNVTSTKIYSRFPLSTSKESVQFYFKEFIFHRMTTVPRVPTDVVELGESIKIEDAQKRS